MAVRPAEPPQAGLTHLHPRSGRRGLRCRPCRSSIDDVNPPEIERLLRRQAGVIARRQVLEAGGDRALVARKVRRREWVLLHDGILIDHTGEPTRRQREWTALLRHPGSVLAGRSALRAEGLGVEPARRDPIEIAVPHGRHLKREAGLTAVQLRGFAEAARLDASPPRLRVEHAASMVASAAGSEDAAVAVLADVVREGATTAARLGDVIGGLPRLPRRALLLEVLADVGEGAESPLERRYLREVERAHGLPRGERQVRELVRSDDGHRRLVVRDVRYAEHRALVELDGRVGHTAALDRWSDLSRDLAAAVDGDVTLRAGWQQVLEPCRLAVLVGGVLRARGWSGRPHPCRSAHCAVPGAGLVAGVECA